MATPAQYGWHRHGGYSKEGDRAVPGLAKDCTSCSPEVGVFSVLRDQENRIRVAIDDLVEFLNVMGAD